MKQSAALMIVLVLAVNGMPQDKPASEEAGTVGRSAKVLDIFRDFMSKEIDGWRYTFTKVGERLARNLQFKLDQQIVESAQAKQFAFTPNEEGFSNDVEAEPTGFVSRLLRAFNMDEDTVANWVYNMVQRVARRINSYFDNSRQSRQVEDEGMVKKIIRFEIDMMKNVYHTIQDKELPEKVIQQLGLRTGNRSACIQLLVCKASPVVWGVQKTIKETPKIFVEIVKGLLKDGTSFVYTIPTHLPTLDEYQSHEVTCMERFPSCPEEDYSPDNDHESNQL